MIKRLDEFIYDEALQVHLHPDYDRKSFNYSDGQEVEDRIYQIIKKSNDVSIFSAELISQINDWPTEYHFSPLRQNLLRHFQLEATDNILELGCGCGAITRQFGESGASVTAIEGSVNRAKCASARCKDLPNVKVVAANFQDIIFEKKYDYVTMIGVFEYCPIFFSGDDPFASCLEIVKNALKPGGKLILAIENRLGLKYFMGLEEDHVGLPFVGIQDLYGHNTAKTFGRSELDTLLKRNGFSSVEFQYPFPDYKIPSVIFTEEAFHNTEFKPAEIIRQFDSRDYSNNAKPLFSENLVWPVIESNKLIPDLSNSFLVIAAVEEEVVKKENSLLAIKYTVDRVKRYNTKAYFTISKTGRIIVKRSKLLEDTNDFDTCLIHSLEDDPYYSGKNLDAEINKMIGENNFEGYLVYIKQWINFIIENGLKAVNKEDIYSSLVLPDFIDCIPSNLIITSGGMVFIDKEWKYMKEFTLTSLLLRYLIYEKNITFISKHLKGQGYAFGTLLRYLGIKFNNIIYEEFLRMYDDIYSEVYGDKVVANNKGQKSSMISNYVLKSISIVQRLKFKILDK